MSESINIGANTGMNADADRLARSRIKGESGLDDLRRNFFVEAGAGSGKTTLLVARMVALIKNGIVDVSRISAITFTKAAAREFYSRFQAALDRGSRSDENTPEQRERCEAALRDIDLCFLDTLDAFCHRIMSEHPVETGIAFDSSVVEGSWDAPFGRVLDEALRGELDDGELARLYYAMAAYQSDPREAVLAGLRAFLDARGCELYLPDMPEKTPDELFGELKTSLAAVADALSADAGILRPGKTSQEAFETLLKYRGLLDISWNDDCTRVGSLLKGIGDLKLDRSPEAAGFPTAGWLFEETGKRAKYYIINAESLKNETRKLEELRYGTLVRFMRSFAGAVAERLRERGKLGFADYRLYLCRSLREDALHGGALARHISARHSVYFIDEFQDTEPMLAEIFFRLAAVEPCEDWRDCVPRPGSLFIVGDPKQSIYRFQSADVAAYMRVRGIFESDPAKGEVLTLSRNFRSVPVMREWFNSVFPPLLAGDGQAEYTAIPPRRHEDEEDHSGLFEGVYSFTSGGKGCDSAYIADRVAGFINSEHCLIWDRKLKKGRRVQPSDIMIINGKGSQLNIVRELAKRGISSYVEGSTDFSGQRDVCAAVAVMGALAAPNDSAAVYAALRSRVFNISDSELYMFKKAGGRLTLMNAGEVDEKDRTAAALRTLRGLLGEVRPLTPYAAFIRMAERLSLTELRGEEARAEYFWYAAELLRAGELNGDIISLADAHELLAKLLGKNLEREMSLEIERRCVHIANLHKVKGLEAPIVILGANIDGNMRLSKHCDHSGSKPFCAVLSVSGSGYDSPTYAKLSDDSEYVTTEKRELTLEDVRKDYVAATRAGSALIIGCTIKADDTPHARARWTRLWLKPSEQPDEPAPLITSVLPEMPLFAADGEVSAAERQSTAPVSLDELRGSLAVPTYSRLLPSKMTASRRAATEDETDGLLDLDSLLFDDADDTAQEPDEEERPAPRTDSALAGTLIHRAMELLVLAGCEYEPEALARRVTGEYALTEERADKFRKMIINVVKKLGRGGFYQENGGPSDILGELRAADAGSIMCETPFCVRGEAGGDDDKTDVILDGVIDLIYHKDGVWHIVDYKTNADGSGLDEHYAEQLSAYREAFARATGQQAETRIYHIEY